MSQSFGTAQPFAYVTSIQNLYPLVFVCFSGFCSGATQGLLSIDELNLEVKRKYGTDSEKKMV
jgi:hypothetical protein